MHSDSMVWARESRMRLPGGQPRNSMPHTGTMLRSTTSKMSPGPTGAALAVPPAGLALGSVGKFIHHVREARPVEPFAALPLAALPVQRSPSDFEGADFFLVGVDLQRQRRSSLRKLEIREVGLDLVL